MSTYNRGGQISEAESAELLDEASKFKGQLEKWLRGNFPKLLGG